MSVSGGALRGSTPIGVRLGMLAVLLWLTVGQRFVLDVSTGGRGILSPLEPVVIVLASLVWVGVRGRRHFLPAGTVTRTVGPLLALLTVMPILGVLLGWYGTQTLYAVSLVALPVAVLTLIAATPQSGSWSNLAFVAIIAHGFYGLAQILGRGNLLPASLWARMSTWDMESQIRYSEHYVVSLRSTGFFVNANTFGLWSVVAVLFSAALLTGKKRFVGVSLGLLGVYGSQSRTALVILTVALVVALGSLVLRGNSARAIPSVLGLGFAGAFAYLLGWFSFLADENAVERIKSGLALFSGGTDQNFEARMMAWEKAMQLSSDYPFGTFGPPQVLLHTSLDNQYVSFFLQGGPVLVVAFVLALLSPRVLRTHAFSTRLLAWLLALVVALAAVTAVAFEELEVMALVWVTAAVAISRERDAEMGSAVPTETAKGVRL